MAGRAGVVGAAGEGEAGRGVMIVEGSGKFKPWNVVGLPAVETRAVNGRGVVGRGVGENAAVG